MTSYLKWAIPGGAALLILGVVIGIKATGSSSEPSSPADQRPSVVAAADTYPAPTVTIISHPLSPSDVAAVRQSSSFYGSRYGDDQFGHRKSKHHKKSSAPKKADSSRADPSKADPELGFMAADDPKLLKAEGAPPKVKNDRTPPDAGMAPQRPAQER